MSDHGSSHDSGASNDAAAVMTPEQYATWYGTQSLAVSIFGGALGGFIGFFVSGGNPLGAMVGAQAGFSAGSWIASANLESPDTKFKQEQIGETIQTIEENITLKTLSDDEQKRLEVERGNFAMEAGQAILGKKVEIALGLGQTKYGASKRGVENKGSALLQLQTAAAAGEKAIGSMEQAFQGSLSGMELTANSALNRAAFAQKEEKWNIDWKQSVTEGTSWINAFTTAIQGTTSLLKTYWKL
jgi:hypothetical protein